MVRDYKSPKNGPDVVTVHYQAIVEDVEFEEIIDRSSKDPDIYVVFNNTGPLCYVRTKDEAVKYQRESKSKSPVRYSRISIKIIGK